jgi:acetyl esterase
MDERTKVSQMDPEIEAVVAMMAEAPPPEDVEGVRRALREAIAAVPGFHDSRVTVTDRLVPGPSGAAEVPVRVYSPLERSTPIPGVLYLHSGGFIAGDLESGHGQCLGLAAEVGCIVVSVDYRLAPEHPYPAAVEDCYAVLQCMAAGSDLGIDTARLAVVGDSAGGTLGAAMALMARDRGGPALALQVLRHGAFDDRNPALQPMWRHYLGGGLNSVPAYAAPARADDLSGVAPAYVVLGALDGLRDEGLAYAGRLLGSGVPTELHLYAGAPHCFELLAPHSGLGQRATREHHRVLRAAFDL